MSVVSHLGLVTPDDGLLAAAKLAEPEGRRPGAPQATASNTASACRRRSTQAWLLAGIGIAVVLILLISAVLANRGTTTSPIGAASPSISAGAATTLAPAATAKTSPSANERDTFRDDFSSRAAGWEGDGVVAERLATPTARTRPSPVQWTHQQRSARRTPERASRRPDFAVRIEHAAMACPIRAQYRAQWRSAKVSDGSCFPCR